MVTDDGSSLTLLLAGDSTTETLDRAESYVNLSVTLHSSLYLSDVSSLVLLPALSVDGTTTADVNQLAKIGCRNTLNNIMGQRGRAFTMQKSSHCQTNSHTAHTHTFSVSYRHIEHTCWAQSVDPWIVFCLLKPRIALAECRRRFISREFLHVKCCSVTTKNQAP